MKDNESINYRILKYLNEQYVRENDHLGSANETVKAIPDIDHSYIKISLYGLATHNAVCKDPNDFYKITPEGEKELNRLQASIDAENNKIASENNVKIAKIASITLSLITLVAVLTQCYYAGVQSSASQSQSSAANRQNILIEEQNDILKQQLLIQTKQFEFDQTGPKQENVEIYVSKGKSVKIDTVKISN
jgi:hypothetical protein